MPLVSRTGAMCCGFGSISKIPVRDPTRRGRLRWAAKVLCGRIDQDAGYRPAMVIAARSFSDLYNRNASLLEMHRFWTVVRHAQRSSRAKVKSEGKSVRIELIHAAFVADTNIRVSVVDRNGIEVAQPLRPFECDADGVTLRMLDWEEKLAQRSRQWFSEGAVPFGSEHFGIWTAKGSFPDGIVPHRYLVRRDRTSLVPAEARAALIQVSEGWYLLGPIDGRHCPAVHRALKIETSGEATKAALRLTNGVRTREGWLGRGTVLPCVQRPVMGELSLNPTNDSNQGRVSVVESSNGLIKFFSEGPLHGAYRLRLEERARDGEALAIEVQARFVADAPLHLDIPPAPRQWIVVDECVDRSTSCIRANASFVDGDATPVDAGFDNLLEVIYAAGRSGWAEGELVDVIRSLCPGPSPWDVLRSLQESGWLDRHVHDGWRAFGWRLSSAHLVQVTTSKGKVVVLQGSASSAVRKRFVGTARELGANVHEQAARGPFAPRTVFASIIDTERLATALNWPVARGRSSAPRPAPACWPRQSLSTVGLVRHREWSWGTGEFREIGSHESGVRLVWYRSAVADTHDVYEVRRGDTRFLSRSRTVALLEAHRQRKKPLFQEDAGNHVRLSSEGHLPLSIARLVGLACLSAPGPVRVNGRWSYVYPDAAHLIDVPAILGPSLFIREKGSEAMPTSSDTLEAQAIARHRRSGWTRAMSV